MDKDKTNELILSGSAKVGKITDITKRVYVTYRDYYIDRVDATNEIAFDTDILAICNGEKVTFYEVIMNHTNKISGFKEKIIYFFHKSLFKLKGIVKEREGKGGIITQITLSISDLNPYIIYDDRENQSNARINV